MNTSFEDLHTYTEPSSSQNARDIRQNEQLTLEMSELQIINEGDTSESGPLFMFL